MTAVAVGQATHLRTLVATTEFLADLDASVVDALAEQVEWFFLAAGDVLFQAGESADGFYIVATGRLRVLTRGPMGAEESVREVSRGECVGEIALLSGLPHTTTVRAIRDTTLVRLPRAAFEVAIERDPRQVLRLARRLAGWLAAPPGASRKPERVTTIALLPIDREAPLAEFGRRLTTALSATGATLYLGSKHIDGIFGSPVAQAVEGDADHHRLTQWLNEQESEHRFVVYEADADSSSWTRRCIRQADRLLKVAAACTRPDGPRIGPRTRDRARGQSAGPGAREELVVLHRDGSRPPQGTSAWLDLGDFAVHHHIRLSLPSDAARLARHLGGTATGLVLGGGGARGFAHIGVIRALGEAGIPIDRIGGTSMGAMVAAQYAAGWDWQDMIRLNREGWVDRRPLSDLTLPLISLVAGRKARKAIESIFGERQIEDLWLSFFCIATNLTRAEQVVFREGRVAKSVLASLSMPGIVPPVVSEQAELLIDGAVVNNLPVDVMQTLYQGPVVAVDVSARSDRFPSACGLYDPLSPWRELRRRLSGRKGEARFPSIFSILLETTLLPSRRGSRQASASGDLYLAPPVTDVDLFDWGSIESVVERGYQWALPRVAAWGESRLRACPPLDSSLTTPRDPPAS